ncbi:MAG: hypothetical protein LBR66_08235 [Candidatus Symbiothrix sp.]|jgi:hypothetical protein|nr:hypothetical protein [Candidatus Symbiothrix sp.]
MKNIHQGIGLALAFGILGSLCFGQQPKFLPVVPPINANLPVIEKRDYTDSLPTREAILQAKADKVGGVLVENVIWAKQNVGAHSPADKGRTFSFADAQKACPKGWRLPTRTEFDLLISSEKASFERGQSELFFPFTMQTNERPPNDVCRYWTYSFASYFLDYRYFSNKNAFVLFLNENPKSVCVRCVLDE